MLQIMAMKLVIFAVILLLIPASSNAETFFFGLPLNLKEWHTSSGLFITSSTANKNVRYTVSVNDVLLGHGFINATASAEVIIPKSYIIPDSSFNNRHKGIIIETSGNANVRGYNSFIDSSKGASTAVFNVLPYKDFLLKEYKYHAVSSQSKYSSLLLLVGYDDDTTIKIKPTIDIQIPQNPQSVSSPVITVDSGSIHTVTLHRGQTLLLAVPGEDLSGTQVASNKPLSVISGHECIQIPSNKGGCDHVLAQIPPSVMWGKEYLLVPAAGRNSGQMIKIQSSVDNMTIKHNCINDATTEVTLENVYEMQTSSRKACHLQSDQPILVAQFTFGQDTDGLGDPSLMIIPSVEQYVQETSFKILPEALNYPNQYVTVITNSVPTLIYLNNKSLQCDWRLIYNLDFTKVAGYTCSLLVTSNTIHTLNSNGHIAVFVFGVNGYRNLRQGYAYNTRLAMNPINADNRINLTLLNYSVAENSGKIKVVVKKNSNLSHSLAVILTTEDISAKSNSDYVPVNVLLVFDVNENEKEVDIIILNDTLAEHNEQFTIRIEAMNYTASYSTIVTILDDDFIMLGFHGVTDLDSCLQVTLMEGRLQPDVNIQMEMRVEFINATDSQNNNFRTINQNFNVSSENKKNSSLMLQCFNGMDSVIIVGLLNEHNIISNGVHILMHPGSIVLLTATDRQQQAHKGADGNSELLASVSQDQLPSGVLQILPSVSVVTSNNFNEYYILILITILSNISTGFVLSLFAFIGCVLAFKCGRRHKE